MKSGDVSKLGHIIMADLVGFDLLAYMDDVLRPGCEDGADFSLMIEEAPWESASVRLQREIAFATRRDRPYAFASAKAMVRRFGQAGRVDPVALVVAWKAVSSHPSPHCLADYEVVHFYKAAVRFLEGAGLFTDVRSAVAASEAELYRLGIGRGHKSHAGFDMADVAADAVEAVREVAVQSVAMAKGMALVPESMSEEEVDARFQERFNLPPLPKLVRARLGGAARFERWSERWGRFYDVPSIPEEDRITCEAASDEFGRHMTTLVRWAEEDPRLGVKVGGRWVLSRSALKAKFACGQ